MFIKLKMRMNSPNELSLQLFIEFMNNLENCQSIEQARRHANQQTGKVKTCPIKIKQIQNKKYIGIK